MSDLETILTDNQPSDAPATAEPVQSENTGVTSATVPPAVATEQAPPSGYAPLAAVQDERRKRQEAEARLKQYEQQLAQRHEQAPPPDWYAEPDRAAQIMQQQVQYTIVHNKVALSQDLAREQYADYDAMEQVFTEAAQQQPHLWQQLYQHPNPAKFAYQQAKKLHAMREIGDDPEAYRQRIIADYQASQGQGQPPPQQPRATPRPQLPTSLARTVSTQPRDERGKFAGRAELSDILGD